MNPFKTIEERDLFSVEEVAQLLDLTVQAVHQWLKRGKIKAHSRTSRKGHYRIHRDELIRFLGQRGTEIPGLWVKPGGRRKRILVIDDYAPIRDVVEQGLRWPRFPFEIRTAASAEDAVLVMAKFRPHLIVLDYFLAQGKLRGDAALALIGSSKIAKSIKVIGMSGDKAVGRRMLGAGADDFIQKPFVLEDLKNMLFCHLFGDKRKTERRRPLQDVVRDLSRRD